MRFDFTPEEAHSTAGAVAKYLKKQKMTVKVEVSAWPDAPCRTTLTASKAEFRLLVEAQGTLDYTATLQELATWIGARRQNCELWLATSSEAHSKLGLLDEMKRDGVGLLIIRSDGTVSQSIRARNPALVVTPDPALRYGNCKADVLAAVEKFNQTDRKDGLRDMCELVERETDAVALRAAQKGWLKATSGEAAKMDWSTKINVLASPNGYHPPHAPILSPTQKDDLHSFRGARNLIDHKVRGKREDSRRQLQFADRMMQGPRLVAELQTCKRRVR